MLLVSDWWPGRPYQERYSLRDIQKMVKKDGSLLTRFTPKEEAEAVARVIAARARKAKGVRANNAAAALDVKVTVDRLMDEVRFHARDSSRDERD